MRVVAHHVPQRALHHLRDMLHGDVAVVVETRHAVAPADERGWHAGFPIEWQRGGYGDERKPHVLRDETDRRLDRIADDRIHRERPKHVRQPFAEHPAAAGEFADQWYQTEWPADPARGIERAGKRAFGQRRGVDRMELELTTLDHRRDVRVMDECHAMPTPHDLGRERGDGTDMARRGDAYEGKVRQGVLGTTSGEVD